MSAIITPSMASLAVAMKRHANTGLYNGREHEANLPYFRGARQLHKSGAMLLLTRDAGYHSSGWWKNPDVERCWHLSLSFWDLDAKTPRPFEGKEAEAWVHCIFGAWSRYIWEESAVLKDNPSEVRHYRVFCDPTWQPIIPRGEVYSLKFTGVDWKSWSDRQYAEGGNS